MPWQRASSAAAPLEPARIKKPLHCFMRAVNYRSQRLLLSELHFLLLLLTRVCLSARTNHRNTLAFQVKVRSASKHPNNSEARIEHRASCQVKHTTVLTKSEETKNYGRKEDEQLAPSPKTRFDPQSLHVLSMTARVQDHTCWGWLETKTWEGMVWVPPCLHTMAVLMMLIFLLSLFLGDFLSLRFFSLPLCLSGLLSPYSTRRPSSSQTQSSEWRWRAQTCGGEPLLHRVKRNHLWWFRHLTGRLPGRRPVETSEAHPVVEECLEDELENMGSLSRMCDRIWCKNGYKK